MADPRYQNMQLSMVGTKSTIAGFFVGEKVKYSFSDLNLLVRFANKRQIKIVNKSILPPNFLNQLTY